MKKIIRGDLIALAQDKQFDVIIHGCNCFNAMGAGIAPQIAKAFPSAYKIDQGTVKGDKDKLGTISLAFDPRYELYIINAYTQFQFGGQHPLDYIALGKCFKQIKTLFHNKRIGYPEIGAGLGGGDWNKISKIIDKILDGSNHTTVEWDLK